MELSIITDTSRTQPTNEKCVWGKQELSIPTGAAEFVN